MKEIIKTLLMIMGVLNLIGIAFAVLMVIGAIRNDVFDDETWEFNDEMD